MFPTQSCIVSYNKQLPLSSPHMRTLTLDGICTSSLTGILKTRGVIPRSISPEPKKVPEAKNEPKPSSSSRNDVKPLAGPSRTEIKPETRALTGTTGSSGKKGQVIIDLSDDFPSRPPLSNNDTPILLDNGGNTDEEVSIINKRPHEGTSQASNLQDRKPKRAKDTKIDLVNDYPKNVSRYRFQRFNNFCRVVNTIDFVFPLLSCSPPYLRALRLRWNQRLTWQDCKDWLLTWHDVFTLAHTAICHGSCPRILLTCHTSPFQRSPCTFIPIWCSTFLSAASIPSHRRSSWTEQGIFSSIGTSQVVSVDEASYCKKMYHKSSELSTNYPPTVTMLSWSMRTISSDGFCRQVILYIKGNFSQSSRVINAKLRKMRSAHGLISNKIA